MCYSTYWNALFSDYMTLEKLLCYPIAHMRSHAGQLLTAQYRPLLARDIAGLRAASASAAPRHDAEER